MRLRSNVRFAERYFVGTYYETTRPTLPFAQTQYVLRMGALCKRPRAPPKAC
jgi:hypothetical protein